MLKDVVSIQNLSKVYDLEVSKNTRNKKRIYGFDLHKMEYLTYMEYLLLNNLYFGNKYSLFVIRYPKKRLIMSQGIFDKTINHFATRYILEPKLSKYLANSNCATRKGKGTSYAINLFKHYLELNKKYDHLYCLKFNIKKYFYNIDHNVLKDLIKKDLDDDEFKLIERIIDSTNYSYINKEIDELNHDFNENLPHYEIGKGLPIGNLSSQFLAIFYLSKLHHYIIHDLHVKYMINYMDDYVIIHHDKDYLKKCLVDIEEILHKDYKLELNKNKTYIRELKYGITFLGYTFRVIDKKTIIKLSNSKKVSLKRRLKKLQKENPNFEKYFSSFMNYKYSYIYTNYYEIEKIIYQIIEFDI